MARIYPRLVTARLTGRTSRKKIKLLLGARQTGKSTVLKSIAAPDAIFINLQDRVERLRFERQPDELPRRLRAVQGKRMVLIDEIQKVPALLDDVQLIYDERPGQFDFFLTGSSARKLKRDSANLLPGRVHQYPLFPVICPERAISEKPVILPVNSGWKKTAGFPAKKIEDILLYGTLPGIMLEAKGSARATLEAYAEIYIEEEIRREALVRNVGPFAAFLELVAMESGNTVNLSKISRLSGIAVSTIKTFYQLLVDTFVGYWLTPFSLRTRKRLLTTPKFYFFDTGARNALARIPLAPGLLKLQAGKLFEQFVVTECYHRCRYLGRGYNLSFWRTATGAEVDLIVQTPKEIIPVEIKWTTNPQRRDARGLEKFLQLHAPRAKRGIIVCRVPERLQLSKNITAIPWQQL